METKEVELLSKALNDPGVQLKHLKVEDYMSVLKLTNAVNDFLEKQGRDIEKLVADYNKDYNQLVRTPEYQAAKSKKLEKKEELTEAETELLDKKPVVLTLPGGMLQGPFDFIDKVNKIREATLTKVPKNFISDQKVFKAVVENASVENQRVLFEYLFK